LAFALRLAGFVAILPAIGGGLVPSPSSGRNGFWFWAGWPAERQAVFLWLAAWVFWWVTGGFSGFGLAGLVPSRYAALRYCGPSGFGPIVILMPNKPVKGTARHSGWQS